MEAFLEPDVFPDLANQCLLAYQQKKQKGNPEYSVMDEPPRKLAFILKMGLRNQVKETTESEDQAETETVVTEENRTAVEENETKAVEVVVAEQAQAEAEEKVAKKTELNNAYEVWRDSKVSFVAMINDADNLPVGEPPNPEHIAARAKLKQFQQILLIASTNEADKAIVTASLSIHVLLQPPVFQTGVL